MLLNKNKKPDKIDKFLDKNSLFFSYLLKEKLNTNKNIL